MPYTTDSEIESKLPEECRELRRILLSEAMLLLLSQVTGILLHPLARQDLEVPLDANKKETEVAGTSQKRLMEGGDAESSGGNTPKRPRLSEQETEEDDAIKTEITAPRFHRWGPGMYTLLADADSGVVATTSPADGFRTYRLDLFYHIGGYGGKASNGESSCSDNQQTWQDSWNGQIVYVSRTDNEEVRPSLLFRYFFSLFTDISCLNAVFFVLAPACPTRR